MKEPFPTFGFFDGWMAACALSVPRSGLDGWWLAIGLIGWFMSILWTTFTIGRVALWAIGRLRA